MIRRNGHVRAVCAASAAVLFVCLSSVRAATYYVAPGGNDAAAGTNWVTAKRTIQAAIDVSAASDTVLVSNGVYATGGRVVSGAMTNRVAITNAITVQSVNGPSFTTIQGAKDPATTNGNAAVRCVFVANGASLVGFTLSGGATRLAGDVTLEQAGGGSWNDSTAVISNCVYTGNDAYNGGGAWGGNLFNCSFVNNRAVFAGGGSLFGVFNRCTFSSNSATYGGGTDGATARNSLYSGNHATAAGGATYLNTLVNCTLVGNSAALEAGGSAYDALTNCIVYFNTSPSSPNHTNSTFAYSCTTPDPGGTGNTTNDPLLVTLDDPHLTAVSPCIDQGRTADAFGSADLAGDARVVNAVVDMGAYEAPVTSRYHFVSTSSPSPGSPYTSWNTAAHTIQEAVDAASNGDVVVVADGVYDTGSRVAYGSMSNRVVINKAITVRSVNGAASTIIKGAHDSATTTNGNAAVRCVYVGANATLAGFTLTNGATRTAGDNSKEQTGGGAWCETSGTLRDCILEGNEAWLYGGGVSQGILSNCTLRANRAPSGGASVNGVFYSCLIVGNRAFSFGGGAYYGTFHGCVFSNNQAAAGGGSSDGIFSACEFLNNRATANGGGAVYGSFSDSVFSGNTANGSGGAVISSTLYNCVLKGNAATNAGGGAYNGTLNGCLVIGNAAVSGGGASAAVLNNCTISENSASYAGGAANCTLNNSISYFNAASVAVGESNYNVTCIFNFSCTAPALGGNNVGGPPLFVNRAAGDYRLSAGSPCVDRGNNGYVAVANDIAGNARILNGVVDIGAYEAQVGIAVLGTNGVIVPAFSTTPTLPEGTDFGGLNPFTGEVTRVFSISNALGSAVTIFGVQVTGVNSSEFTVVSFPASVDPGARSNLVVHFAPQDYGSRTATVEIRNSDPYRTNYTFAVKGYGIYPKLGVRSPTDAVLLNGQITTSIQDGSNLGLTPMGVPITRTFKFVNEGTKELFISSVTTSGPAASMFTFLSSPAQISPGGVSNVVIQFNPSAGGLATAVVAVASDDLYTPLYTFSIAGMGAVSGTQYVATNSPSPAPPYTNWQTAAHSLQDALDWALSGNSVVATDGVYAAGGKIVHGAMNNRVVVPANVALRSVNGPEVTIIEGAGPVGPAAVRCAYVGTNAVLSGFTLRNGATLAAGDQIKERNGGGVWCETSGVVSNCIVTGCSAENVGDGAAFGTYFNCLLTGNTGAGGGGAYNATLNNTKIVENTANLHGGGVWNCTLNNCLLVGNDAAQDGGGAYRSVAINCTIVSNAATGFGGGTIFGTNWNSIVYFNTAPTGTNDYQSLVEYTCITPDPGGTGNITGDPLFRNISSGDYRLLKASPCRDAGNNGSAPVAFDLDGQPRIVGAAVDMGAYERGTSTIWYVATNGNDAADGESWGHAKQTIQAGVDEASAGELVLVSNGVYDAGARVTPGYGTSNRVVITNNIVVQSVNGRSLTIIRGLNVGNTNDSIRCVYITAGLLSGFTLTNGYAPPLGAGEHQNQSGGGAYASGGALSNCLIAGNAASSAAGGVFGGLLTDCQIYYNSAPNGGGAVNANLVGCDVAENHANDTGGGMYNSTATQCNVVYNTAIYGGGTAYTILKDSTVAANVASQRGGGGFYGSFSNCTIRSNSSIGGGGTYYAQVIDSVLANNSADYIGGAGAYDGNLVGCTIVSNTTPNGYGGGAIWATLSNCTIAANSAYAGAGVSRTTVRNSKLSGNTADTFNGRGGGAEASTLINCMMSGNVASKGGGSYSNNLLNCTIAANQASSDSGGTFGGSQYNCIIFSNSAPANANWSGTSLVYCCTTPLPPGAGNTTNDPRFVDAVSSNFHLLPNSPCIDIGNYTYLINILTDLDGNPRIANGYVDMGAYEYQGAGPADYDGDGMGNGDEIVAGFDPFSSTSVWKVTAITVTNPAAIQFGTVTGRTYAVERNSNLAANPQVWTQFTNNIPGTGSPIIITDPLATNRNYRVRVQLAP